MERVGVKTVSAAIVLILWLIMFITLFIAGIIVHIDLSYIILLFIGIVSMLVMIVDYFSIPYVLVEFSDDKVILKGKIIIEKDKIRDVRSRRSRVRSMSINSGSVTIITNTDEYKLRYVANCEDVARNILFYSIGR